MSGAASIVLVALLIAISVQDIKTLRIADGLNALLALLGAIWWVVNDPPSLVPQIIAAVLAASLLWSVREVHAKATGRIGLGLGDVKLMGAGMMWVNPMLFPLLLFTASAVGLIAALSLSGINHADFKNGRTAFGPYLSFAIGGCWFLEMAR